MQTGSTIDLGLPTNSRRYLHLHFRGVSLAVLEIGHGLPFRGEKLTHCHDDRYTNDDCQERVRQQEE